MVLSLSYFVQGLSLQANVLAQHLLHSMWPQGLQCSKWTCKPDLLPSSSAAAVHCKTSVSKDLSCRCWRTSCMNCWDCCCCVCCYAYWGIVHIYNVHHCSRRACLIWPYVTPWWCVFCFASDDSFTRSVSNRSVKGTYVKIHRQLAKERGLMQSYELPDL